MNRTLFIIVFILILISSVFYIYFRRLENEESVSETNISNTVNELPLITIATNKEDDPQNKMRISIAVPSIKIMSNSVASDYFNSYVLRFIDDEKNKFITKIKNETTATSTEQNILNTFSLTSTAVLNTPKIIVIRFDKNSLSLHKAIADTGISFMVFDIEKSKVLNYEDFFIKEEAITYIKKFIENDSEIYKDSVPAGQVFELSKLNHHIMIDKDNINVSIDVLNKESKNEQSILVLIPITPINDVINQNIKEAVFSEKEYIRMSEPE